MVRAPARLRSFESTLARRSLKGQDSLISAMAGRAGATAVVVAFALLAGACSGGSSDKQGPDRAGEAVADAEVQSGLDILDEAIPAVDIHGDYWPEHDDLRSITCASDIVFIGRVTGYTPRLLTVPPAGEDPDPSSLSDILDGLVLTVDELLIGDLGGSAQVTVAFLALTVNEDGSPHSRVVGAPFAVIRPGIEQRGSPDGPLYLVYAVAGEASSPFDLPDVYYFNTNGGVTQVLADSSLDVGADRPFGSGHGLGVEAAREAALAAKRLCVKPPLPSAARHTWYNQTGLLLTVHEEVWAGRLDRVCKTALGPDLDSPVWDRAAGLALAEEFADADGLRPDVPPDWREQFLRGASTTLWIMIVQRTGLDGPSVCWDRVPTEFIEAGPPATAGRSQPLGFDTHVTDEVQAAVKARFDRMFWWVEPPLPPGTREIWWEATGLRATVDEDVWASRLNRACNTPLEDPVWDRAAAPALAEEFIVQDGGEPSPELVEVGADALWRMTAVPLSGACSWHYPPETFEPEFFEQMNEIRRAALAGEIQS